jgi:uncharacterized protein YecA (UPF0149 family)
MGRSEKVNTMNLNDLKKELRDAKNHHLKIEELDSYIDQELDRIALARAEAHLRQCLICEEQLAILKEEREAFDNEKATDKDIVLAKRLIQQMWTQQEPLVSEPSEVTSRLSLQDRLAVYLRQAVESWRAYFGQLNAVRGASDRGEEVWRWQSAEGTLKARAVLEKNGDLTIHVSSNEPELEGVRLKIHLGPVDKEITLRRLSESELYAEARIPLRQRAKDMTDISIEKV